MMIRLEENATKRPISIVEGFGNNVLLSSCCCAFGTFGCCLFCQYPKSDSGRGQYLGMSGGGLLDPGKVLTLVLS